MNISKEVTDMKPGQMGFMEFLHKYCTANGSWTAMLLSGIENAFPEHYAQMPDKPDKEYSLEEVFAEITACGVIFDE